MYLEVATALLIILNINTFSAGIIRHWQPIKNMRIEKGNKTKTLQEHTFIALLDSRRRCRNTANIQGHPTTIFGKIPVRKTI